VLLEWDPVNIIHSVFKDPEAREIALGAVLSHEDWAALDRGTLTESEAVFSFSKRTGLPASEIDRLMLSAKESLVPIPGSHVILDELHQKGFELYCLSNMSKGFFSHVEAKYTFWKKFRATVISAHIGMVKPEPQIFRYMQTTFGIAFEHTLFIDDGEKNVEAARRLGMTAIHFESPEDCRRRIEPFLAQD